jgi:hypothetical protein
VDLIDIGLKHEDFIHLAKDRSLWKTPANMVMNPEVP